MDRVQKPSNFETSLSVNEPRYLGVVTAAVEQEETCLLHVFRQTVGSIRLRIQCVQELSSRR
jgi:hypothetical protein